MASSTEERIKELAGEDEPTAGESIFKVAKRFAFKSVAWFGIYILGYYGFSIAWLLTPLLLTVFRQQWKKERDFRLSAARQAALTNEKAMIESRIKIEDLPSWVFFPDKERAEWINSIIQQLWPNVGHYTRKVIAESVEPAVKGALEGYGLSGFRFDKVVLGQVPPRITGIKVYDKNTSRKEIIMDLDLIFASDCDIKFSVKNVKAKIGDFSLRGLLRVVLKPLVSEIPLVGGVQVYFLSPPEINFDLGGVANFLDVPGLSNIIRNVVVEQIGNFIVLPNKITVPLATGVSQQELKCPSPSGVLRVRLFKAEKLAKKDIGILGMGKSDPYATLSVGSRRVKSDRIDNTVNPEWSNFVGDFPIEVVRGQELLLELFDHDDNSEDEPLGHATVATGLVADKGQISDMWVDLEGAKSGRALLSLSWLEVTNEREDIDKMKGEGLTKCLLEVFVDSCKGLHEKTKKPCPIVVMDVGGKDNQSTWAQNHTIDPVFEQGFIFLVMNPHTDNLHVRVLDSAISSDPFDRNALLGEVNITISDLLRRDNMGYSPPQPFDLKQGTGTITISAKLRGLRKGASTATTMKTEKQMEPAKEMDKLNLDTTKRETLRQEDSMKSTISGVTEPLLTEESKEPSTPSLDEIMASTVDPMIQTTGHDVDLQDLMVEQEEPCTLRKRTNVAATCPNGKIKLSLSYNAGKEEMSVTVHEARGLPGGDLPDPPDPYVKLYLLPERSKKSKNKTDVKKDTVTPIYDETFEYDLASHEMHQQQLEVSVVDRKGIFARGSLMGRAVVPLSDVERSGGITEWFELEEDDDDSD